MVVNSVRFLFFFIVVFTVYYLQNTKKSPRRQNCWLLLASYFFYAIVSWQMVMILVAVTVVFYNLGLWLKAEMVKSRQKQASQLTALGVVLGLVLLLYFKYLNFFGESVAELLTAIGLKTTWTTLNIIVPVGVSFFTFKLISYVIEIHREHIEPSRDIVEFATYIAFFPTLLAGPIDRPNSFLPQLRYSHSLDYAQAVDGCRQILWGVFTKVCIADRLALTTGHVWEDFAGLSGSTLLIWCLLFTMQIYADFDGYSNMAIGVGKILGFRITRNFNHPMLARNIAEFWRNWHISLTSWITDYMFMPLCIVFRNKGRWGVFLALTINFVIIGMWHGADWTFALFGLYHAMLYIPLVLSGAFGKNKKLLPNYYGMPKLSDLSKMVVNYVLVSLGFVFFYASNVSDALHFYSVIFSTSLFSVPMLPVKIYILAFMLVVFVMEWLTRKREYPLQLPAGGLFRHTSVRYALYAGIALVSFVLAGEIETFIYYKF